MEKFNNKTSVFHFRNILVSNLQSKVIDFNMNSNVSLLILLKPNYRSCAIHISFIAVNL